MTSVEPLFEAYSLHDQFHKWAFPGMPVEVWLQAGALQRLSQDLSYVRQLRADQKEIGGLLLGNRGPLASKITTVETYCSGTLAQLLAVVRRRIPRADGGDQPEALGYYRVIPGLLEPSPDDFSLMRDSFGSPGAVFVMIRPGAAGDACVFFAAGNEFTAAKVKAFQTIGEQEGGREVAGGGAFRSSVRKRFLWGGLITAAFAGIVIGGEVLARYGMHGTPVVPTSITTPPIRVASKTNSYGEIGSGALGFAAAIDGANVKITWNPRSVGVATKSVLSIQDGEERLDTPLSAVLLDGGIFWYSPHHDNVEFTLEVAQADGRRVRDSATVHRRVSLPAAFVPSQASPPPEPLPAATAASLLPPKAVSQPWPVVPADIKRSMSKDIAIDLILSIDAAGIVVDAQARGPGGQIADALGRIAANTARHWTFEPARIGNRPVASQISIAILFAMNVGTG